MTKHSIQLRKLREIWYPIENNRIKTIPRNIPITPNVLLNFYTGDGSLSQRHISLYTLGFKEDDISFLKDKLNEAVNINAKYYFHSNNKAGEPQYRIQISRNEDKTKFLEYLENAHPTSLAVAKSTFPWKFDLNLKKGDFFDLTDNWNKNENL
ncbi:MAG: hypothetical protein ACXAC7_10875 [Candidatus Hodarchaeales archaeon]